jgi:hypothetical protein
MMMGWRRWLVALVAGCGDDGGTAVDAAIVNVDAPADAKQFLDVPPPMFDFSCVNNPAPTTAAAQITVTGVVTRVEFTGTLMFNPLDGASVRACAAPGSPNCNTSGNQYGSTVTTANGGKFSIGPFASNGEPVDAYVEMTETSSRTTLLFPDEPFTSDANATMLTFTPQVVSALALLSSGCTQAAGNGMLGFGVVDCANQPIADTANLTLTVQQGGNEVQGTTVMDLGAVNGAAAGLFLICNVPPNDTTTIGAAWNGMPLRSHAVKVVAGTTSQTVLRPGYR